MNCSDAIDVQNDYCVASAWKSMRFTKPLLPGAPYRSYVKMIPTVEDPSAYFGDVYIMQDDAIVGVVGGIEFRRYPRILLSRFFSLPDKMTAIEGKPKVAVAQTTVAALALGIPKAAVIDTQPARSHNEILPPIPTATAAPPKVVKGAAAATAAVFLSAEFGYVQQHHCQSATAHCQ